MCVKIVYKFIDKYLLSFYSRNFGIVWWLRSIFIFILGCFVLLSCNGFLISDSKYCICYLRYL